MLACMRWYGPQDPVTLADLRQSGCEGVFTALHEIPYGETWSAEAIQERKDLLESHQLQWAAVESVPVSEAIKTRTGDFEQHLENYCTTLKNLGAAGVSCVIYNFMPVLDWVRTDLSWELPDGSQCLRFNPIEFAAFELFLLKRAGAQNDYTQAQIDEAERFFNALDTAGQAAFERKLIDMFPGCKMGLNLDVLRDMLKAYANIDAQQLKEHLSLFLKTVAPVADAAGVRLAIHPDDPPMPILGLPRIVSTEQDLADILSFSSSPANGLCFCSGSLGARLDNPLPNILKRFAERIHAVHLRSVQHESDGCFYEANHLEGCANLPELTYWLLQEQERRKSEQRQDCQLPMRPDHGHRMLDDLKKPDNPNPGYDCLGRMRALAELRGLQAGLQFQHFKA